ncbi:MAG: flagellar basal body P-ring formation protein FlgA [Candidatus Paracaedibacteraceae bacterium]|nr:flagellar basal body P-ring formation protein FlgA [Candidatus Paracaedibacteraceae bacterium]
MMTTVVLILTLFGFSFAGTFNAQDLSQSIKSELQSHVPFSGDFNVHLSSQNWSVQGDKIQVNDVLLQSDQRSFQASVSVITGDTETRLKTIVGKIDPLTDVPMLTRIIAPGDEITSADISWQKLPSTRINQNFVVSQDDLIGKTPRNRVLQPGQPVSKHDVRYPIVVKRGDTVAVAYRTDNMMLTTTGIAEKDAAVGDTVRLKTGGNKIIQAKVIGSQKAEIKPMEF